MEEVEEVILEPDDLPMSLDLVFLDKDIMEEFILFLLLPMVQDEGVELED